ncbi:MAG: xylulokinase, partial [Proteobacteria bacterium]|nr:xylulokinase [Pseudomonadota bacterium]
MYLGIDLGTSAVKAVIVDDAQGVVGEASVPLEIDRPHPDWSEQDPESWWAASCSALDALKLRHARELSAVQGIGLSGQMHGATLLDAADRVLRPAILWNDGRSSKECGAIEAAVPSSREITGNLAMPGFTAPKLLWVARHEPDIFRQIAKVLLPKDYLRLRLTGDYVSDMSDSSGTLWLDVARRDWSDIMLRASNLTREHMPRLVEGSEPGGALRNDLANRWGIGGGVVVAGGAGDNAAGAVGIGAVTPGQAFVSLGTSGVYFVCNASFSPNPGRAVHAFCHCLPGTWHQMSVILSAASCLTWVTKVTGARDEAALLEEVEAAGFEGGNVIFLPYLSGERTPHNDPNARGVFFGLTHDTDRAALGRAVLEGVAFAFLDGQDALLAAGADIGQVSIIGGGARSSSWARILASALGRPLTYHSGGAMGPAYGAARLARLATTGEPPDQVCVPPPVERIFEPEAPLRDPLM